MKHWYEMEGFAADPKILDVYETNSARLQDLADGNPHDPTIQAVYAAHLASLAHHEMLAQYIQSILRIQDKGEL